MCSKDSVINLSSSSLENAQELTNVHLMPCKIHHNGPAKVEEYFQAGMKEQSTGKYKGLLLILVLAPPLKLVLKVYYGNNSTDI